MKETERNGTMKNAEGIQICECEKEEMRFGNGIYIPSSGACERCYWTKVDEARKRDIETFGW